ncbi:MAG: hypothetical protein H0W88_07800 [Parachlamydiaceae bacterium]|nr:hypothetical protein [Parachlamydiaceae bacterium]
MQPQVTDNTALMHASILSPSDAVFGQIMSYLPPKASGQVLITCSELRSRILQNETIWRNYALHMKISRPFHNFSWRKTVFIDSFWEKGVLKETKVKLQVNTPTSIPQLCEEGPKRVFHFYNGNAIESHDLNVNPGENVNNKTKAHFHQVLEANNKGNTICFNDGEKVLGVEIMPDLVHGTKTAKLKIAVYDRNGKIEQSLTVSPCVELDAIRIMKNILILHRKMGDHWSTLLLHPLSKDLVKIKAKEFSCQVSRSHTVSPTHITLFRKTKVYKYNLDEQRIGPLKPKDLELIPISFKKEDIPLTTRQRLIVQDRIIFLGDRGLFIKDLRTGENLADPNFNSNFDYKNKNTDYLIPSNDGSHIFGIVHNNPKDPEKNGLLIFNALNGKQIRKVEISDSNKDYANMKLSYSSIGYLDKYGDFVFKEFTLPPELVIVKGDKVVEEPTLPLIEESEISPVEPLEIIEMNPIETIETQPTKIVENHKKIKQLTLKSTFLNNIKKIAKWGLLAFAFFAIIKALYILKTDQKFRLIK